MDRDVLYNSTLSPEDAVLAMLGLSLDEGVNNGDIFEVTTADELHDVDTGIGVPAGHFSVTAAEDGLVHIVTFNPANKTYGGKEYSLHSKHLEQQIVAGVVVFPKTLGEGRTPGTVQDPRQIRAMFVKGYLRKQDRADGGTNLQYARRSFPSFQSGNPNPEFRVNKARNSRKRRRMAAAQRRRQQRTQA